MDIRELLEKMDDFAGQEVGQKPGDQVRGTERAKTGGKQHPFKGRLVGGSCEESVLPELNKLSKERNVHREISESWNKFQENMDDPAVESRTNYHANRTGFARGARDSERHDLDVPAPQVWGLKINGKVWAKDGKDVTFNTREAALNIRNAILKNRPDLEIGLVTKGGEQGMTESNSLDRYRQRVQSQGFTDSPEERNADRLERKRRHQDALNSIADIGGLSAASHANAVKNRDEERAHQAQQRMARDEYKLDRMKRDDDDWENTFDMMRDRLNRYQWSSQRDVDPEQLAAISNIKYEPRQKNEAVQAKTNDELLAYYAQRKAEKEKQGTSKGGQVHGQPQWQKPRVPNPTFTPGKPLPQSLQQKLDNKKQHQGVAEVIDYDTLNQVASHAINTLGKPGAMAATAAGGAAIGGVIGGGIKKTIDYFQKKKEQKAQDRHLKTPGMAEGKDDVDSLVTDTEAVMKKFQIDAEQALKIVLGDREYNSRRGFYSFYIRQIIARSKQQGVAEGFGGSKEEFAARDAWVSSMEKKYPNGKITLARSAPKGLVIVDGKTVARFPAKKVAEELTPTANTTMAQTAGTTTPAAGATTTATPQDAAKSQQQQALAKRNLGALKTAGVDVDPAKAMPALQKAETGAPMNTTDQAAIAKMAPALGKILQGPQGQQLANLVKSAGAMK